MTSVPPAARPQSKGNPCTGAAPPPTVSSLVSPPIACSLVVCICFLARFLCFFILRSGQTIARASIETLPHKRVAAAYIHWLIAANGIASSQRDALGYGCCPCCWLWQGHRRTLPPSLAATRSPPLAPQDGQGMADPFVNLGDGLGMWDNPTSPSSFPRFLTVGVRRMRTARAPRWICCCNCCRL